MDAPCYDWQPKPKRRYPGIVGVRLSREPQQLAGARDSQHAIPKAFPVRLASPLRLHESNQTPQHQPSTSSSNDKSLSLVNRPCSIGWSARNCCAVPWLHARLQSFLDGGEGARRPRRSCCTCLQAFVAENAAKPSERMRTVRTDFSRHGCVHHDHARHSSRSGSNVCDDCVPGKLHQRWQGPLHRSKHCLSLLVPDTSFRLTLCGASDHFLKAEQPSKCCARCAETPLQALSVTPQRGSER
mmetsp:Transcript_21093/g.48993  ORF Transcript_21093/g.48993 Transcript_21093/m.48993 type:complete len:242 (-) Transcript_21093:865-1590(-)